jgi:hypothetical protein
MTDDHHTGVPDDQAQAYEAPEISDLDTPEGPAVTAAGKTLFG